MKEERNAPKMRRGRTRTRWVRWRSQAFERLASRAVGHASDQGQRGHWSSNPEATPSLESKTVINGLSPLTEKITNFEIEGGQELMRARVKEGKSSLCKSEIRVDWIFIEHQMIRSNAGRSKVDSKGLWH